MLDTTETHFKTIYQGNSRSLPQLQQKCWEQWDQAALPTRANERWRYSRPRLKSFDSFPWQVSTPLKDASPRKPTRYACSRLTLDAGNIVSWEVHPDDQEALLIHDNKLPFQWLDNTLTAISRDPLLSLGVATARTCTMLEVPKNTTVKHPILVEHLSPEEASFTSSAIWLEVGEGSSLTIYESSPTAQEQTSCSRMSYIHAQLRKNAKLNHFAMHHLHPTSYLFSTLVVEQDSYSRVESGAFAFGGALQRNTFLAHQNGENCESSGYGLFVGNEQEQVEQQTEIVHNGFMGKSWQKYRGILNGNACGVFLGGVKLTEAGQKTDAQQLNKNILLTEGAKVYTKPQLIIDANDVKCSHGATISQLREEEVFYLTSRGLQPSDARKMLSHAFGTEIIQQAPESFQTTLAELLSQYVS
ncbi:MAG: Fe-S cluster assembly protein SufD [Zetaproteobacteria bacterium]|nr:Fe-S cluster assembly protein SufD [Zetaproteobacteria bacterium]